MRTFILRDLAGTELARGSLSKVARAIERKWPDAGIVGAQWTLHSEGQAVAGIQCLPVSSADRPVSAPAVEPEMPVCQPGRPEPSEPPAEPDTDGDDTGDTGDSDEEKGAES